MTAMENHGIGLNNNKNDAANVENVSIKKPSLWGRGIKWFRAPDENDSTKCRRKVFAIFIAVVLSITVVGIVPVVLGARTWSKQNKELAKFKPGTIRPDVLTETLSKKLPVGKGDYTLEQLKSIKFAEIPENDILA